MAGGAADCEGKIADPLIPPSAELFGETLAGQGGAVFVEEYEQRSLGQGSQSSSASRSLSCASGSERFSSTSISASRGVRRSA